MGGDRGTEGQSDIVTLVTQLDTSIKPTQYLTPANGVSHHMQRIPHKLSSKTIALKAENCFKNYGRIIEMRVQLRM